MLETTIKTARRTVTIKIDPNRYEIEYVESEECFILRRLEDGKVLKIFSDNIGFLVQHDEKDSTSFVVSEYDEQEKSIMIRHYKSDEYEDFSLCANLRSYSWKFDNCFISGNSYVGMVNRNRGYIYNLSVGRTNSNFDKIYFDDKIRRLFGDNTVLVTMTIGDSTIVRDTITYGINPETFAIVTPIWSELQQRYINVCTKEELEEINRKLKKGNLNYQNYSLGELTIYLEIERYLEELTHYLQHPKSVYRDVFEEEIDEEFVKSFIKK